MSTQKLVIIKKAVTNLTKNIYFVNRWVSSSSLVAALDFKFEFDKNYEVNKCSSLDNLNINNEGMYRGTNNSSTTLGRLGEVLGGSLRGGFFSRGRVGPALLYQN